MPYTHDSIFWGNTTCPCCIKFISVDSVEFHFNI